MAETIGFIVFSMCVVTWFIYLLKEIADKRKNKKNDQQALEKQEVIESRIRKIEDIYGEKATLIMFQEFNIPNICELLVILEEAQIILILGEAYNFSEILNLKIGKSDYIRLKHTTAKLSPPANTLEQCATGIFSANTIKEVIKYLEETQEPVAPPQSEKSDRIDIMTSRLENSVISISPSCHTADEIIIILSIIIDQNDSKWTSVEIPSKH